MSSPILLNTSSKEHFINQKNEQLFAAMSGDFSRLKEITTDLYNKTSFQEPHNEESDIHKSINRKIDITSSLNLEAKKFIEELSKRYFTTTRNIDQNNKSRPVSQKQSTNKMQTPERNRRMLSLKAISSSIISFGFESRDHKPINQAQNKKPVRGRRKSIIPKISHILIVEDTVPVMESIQLRIDEISRLVKDVENILQAELLVIPSYRDHTLIVKVLKLLRQSCIMQQMVRKKIMPSSIPYFLCSLLSSRSFTYGDMTIPCYIAEWFDTMTEDADLHPIFTKVHIFALFTTLSECAHVLASEAYSGDEPNSNSMSSVASTSAKQEEQQQLSNPPLNGGLATTRLKFQQKCLSLTTHVCCMAHILRALHNLSRISVLPSNDVQDRANSNEGNTMTLLGEETRTLQSLLMSYFPEFQPFVPHILEVLLSNSNVNVITLLSLQLLRSILPIFRNEFEEIQIAGHVSSLLGSRCTDIVETSAMILVQMIDLKFKIKRELRNGTIVLITKNMATLSASHPNNQHIFDSSCEVLMYLMKHSDIAMMTAFKLMKPVFQNLLKKDSITEKRDIDDFRDAIQKEGGKELKRIIIIHNNKCFIEKNMKNRTISAKSNGTPPLSPLTPKSTPV